MDPWFIAFVLLAVIAAGAAIRLTRRRRADAAERERLASLVDREAARAATERTNQELLIDLLATGVLTLDARLRIVGANPAAHDLLGRAPGQLLGRSVMEAFLDTGAEAIAQAALDDGVASGEVQLTNADGPTLIVQARRSVEGGLWLVLQDVSELRRLQRIRAEFIDNLSHELRTPLTTVSLLAETLAREAEGPGSRVPAKMRERIGKIEIETGHLVQMVSELLDLSRIESGGTLQLVDGLDLGRLASESIERLRLFADRQGVALQVIADANVPPVRGDGARLGQVVINLVHNAVKFSPDGGDVTVHVRAAPGEVVTSVQDHGVGVPRAAQDRVFERFYKVDRARLRAGAGGGTGLGLAIARHVVEQHGGRIWLESVEGRGSTFSFAIPVAADGTG